MDDDRTLSPPRCTTSPATVAVPLQNLLSQPTKVFLILPLERVASGAETYSENFFVTAAAMECSLNTCPGPLHSLASLLFRRAFRF
jgi:hypothetical protein